MNEGDQVLTDESGRVFGSIVIDRAEGTLRIGKFIPIDWPAELDELFNRYDDLINDQVLSVLDEIEEKIAARGFCVSVSGSDRRDPIMDIQITRDRRISFRAVSTAGP